MRNLVCIITVLALFSCAYYDHSADKIAFEDTEKTYKLMVEQKEILRKCNSPNGSSGIWTVENGNFFIYGKSLTDIPDNLTIISDLGLTKNELETLKNSSLELSKMGVCGALNI
ncbi:MAG: hypothetical protein K2Q22_00365, partial [Cytophagales bacterium]|nr:hypothetical protein [Cytophagales bacterium]